MAAKSSSIDLDEQLARLSRREMGAIKDERALVTATGTAPAAWAVKVMGLAEYNVYNVRQISLEGAGFVPSMVGSKDMQAYNLAESFTASGSVASGTYAVMWRAGDDNVFYVKP